MTFSVSIRLNYSLMFYDHGGGRNMIIVPRRLQEDGTPRQD